MPLPYMYPDLNTARDLQAAGAAAVMPLAAPIGSNRGLATRDFIQILIEEIDLPIIVDAGIGRPSQACEGRPMPASTIIGKSISSIKIWIKSRVASPRLEPIGAASGITAAAPAACKSRAVFKSGYI